MSTRRDAMIHLDDTELRNLEVDLTGAPGRVQRNARHTLVKGAQKVETGMKVDASGHRRLKHLPKSVSRELLDPWTAEIGMAPKRGTQGSLAHIAAYGSVNNAPVFDHTASLRRETPGIVQDFADAAERSVLGGDGVA